MYNSSSHVQDQGLDDRAPRNLKVWICHSTSTTVNLRLCETARPWFQNSRLQDENSPKNDTLRSKHFQDLRLGQNSLRPTFFKELFYNY